MIPMGQQMIPAMAPQQAPQQAPDQMSSMPGMINEGGVPPTMIADAMTDAVGALEHGGDPAALATLHELIGDEMFSLFMEIMQQNSTSGRLMKGPGGPTDDAIPAMIDGVQPAALSDGEFVVNADAVQQLGDGSTDAGAATLEKMMALANSGKPAAGLEALAA